MATSERWSYQWAVGAPCRANMMTTQSHHGILPYATWSWMRPRPSVQPLVTSHERKCLRPHWPEEGTRALLLPCCRWRNTTVEAVICEIKFQSLTR